ncbi:MAG: hypothetical protein KAG34_05530 [Cocleimonas sp.]|nr:hypothetical protein [Cocleimonas sp.]
MNKSIYTLGLIALATSLFAGSVQAAQVSKGSGAASPVLSDFAANQLNYPFRASGYNDTNQNRMFLETFKIKRCKVKKAHFSIKLKRLGAQDRNDAFHMISNQQVYFSEHPIWTNNAASRVISHNFNAAELAKISNGRFSFLVQDDTSVMSARLTYHCANSKPKRKGMTWKKNSIDQISGVVDVGCGNGNQKCNPTQGDRMCHVKLPILCKRALGLPKPASLIIPNKYHKWSKNVIATTPKISPNSLAPAGQRPTLAQANQYCKSQFGSGWKVAEFHDGWGWNFKAYGNTGRSKRFWVNINDKPNGNCWTQ